MRPTSPASRSATISAKAKRHRSSHSRPRGPNPPTRPLLGRLGAADLDADEVASLQDLFVRSGALKEVEREIDRLLGETHRALDTAPITPDARALLGELADYVAWRDH